MYLSKIVLPWQKAKNPYDIHRELWHLFPGREDEKRDFLFRVEKQEKGYGAMVLMQSDQKPSSANNDYLRDNRKYEIKLTKGQSLRFRLRANPVKTIDDEAGRLNRKGEIKKCRVPLIREDEQKKWIERKLEGACSLDSLSIQQEVPLYFRKTAEQRTGKIQTVLFDGVLQIEHPDIFMAIIKAGVGPAKAFGCGLISIASI